MEPSPRTPSGEPPTIGGFGEADVAKAMLQLNVVRQIAEEEEFERAVALASNADVTLALIETTEEVSNERDEAVWRLSASLIEDAHRASRKVGICGQAPSDCLDFAAFLVEQGIDSISLSPGAEDPGGGAEERPAQRTSLTLRKATKGDEEMNSLPTKILVATDGLQNAVAARSAAEMARAFGSELHVVHVVPVTEPYHLFDKDAEGPSLYEEDRQRAQELLDEQVRRIEENGGKVTNVYLRTGEPDAEVVSLGEEIGPT